MIADSTTEHTRTQGLGLIGGGVLSPSINSLLTQRVAARQRGEILGASAACFSAANVLAPLVGGALFQVAGASAPFWL